jgi:dihydrodipicolinate synthase/N-acetylneuraminate lyase
LEDLQALAEDARPTPFTFWAGYERIYVPAKSFGVHGIVSGLASAVPELMIGLQAALSDGNADRIAKLEARVGEFLDWTELFPFPAGIKEAAQQRKLKIGALAAPLSEAEGRKLEEFREWFRGWLPEVLRECAS